MNNDIPDYVVVRAGADLPDGFLPPSHDGRWYDRSTFGPPPTEGQRERIKASGISYSEAVCVPTDRFETREDGAVAQVWEMRP